MTDDEKIKAYDEAVRARQELGNMVPEYLSVAGAIRELQRKYERMKNEGMRNLAAQAYEAGFMKALQWP